MESKSELLRLRFTYYVTLCHVMEQMEFLAANEISFKYQFFLVQWKTLILIFATFVKLHFYLFRI